MYICFEMAYNKKDLLDSAFKAITEHNVTDMEELISFLPCAVPTFYDHFPLESKESKDIKRAIDNNKVALKTKLRNKWKDSDNATLQIALYKLLGTDEEYIRLANARSEITQDIKMDAITVKIIDTKKT